MSNDFSAVRARKIAFLTGDIHLDGITDCSYPIVRFLNASLAKDNTDAPVKTKGTPTETASPIFVYDFQFTKGVIADSYGTMTNISNEHSLPITADYVVISVENGMPEKLYTTCAEVIIEYTVELIFEDDTVINLYPTTTLLTDTNGVVINCEYNKNVNKLLSLEPSNNVDKQVALIEDVKELINLTSLSNLLYPTGSIYTTTLSEFNPNNTFSGVWEHIEDALLYSGSSEIVFIWKRIS